MKAKKGYKKIKSGGWTTWKGIFADWIPGRWLKRYFEKRTCRKNKHKEDKEDV